MRVEIEFTASNDNGSFMLCFWNWHNGDDVCADIDKDGSIQISQYDDKGNELPNKVVSFLELLQTIKQKVDVIENHYKKQDSKIND